MNINTGGSEISYERMGFEAATKEKLWKTLQMFNIY